MEDVLPPEARLPGEMYEVAVALRNQLEMHLELGKPAAPGLRAVVEFAAQHIVVTPGVFDTALDLGNGSGGRPRRRHRVVERPESMMLTMEVGGREQENEGEEEEEEEEEEEDEEWEKWLEEEEDEEWEEWLGEKEEEEEIISPGDVLPSQLLPAIFARLPLPDVEKLRFLSKEWKYNIDTPGSAFRQLWEKVRTTRFAIIYPLFTKDRMNSFGVSAYDSRTKKWYEAIYASDRHYLSICACEGGLVCFVYYVVDNQTATTRNLKMEDQMRLIVWNPLTGDEDQLPALPRYANQRAFHRVVQLSVDRERKSYTVRLISRTSGTKHTPERYETAVYNTESRFWYSDQFQYEPQALDRFIYGRSYRCAHYDVTGDVLRGIWSYDIANRVLIEARMDLDLMDERTVPFPISRIALTDGRVFRLYKGSVSQPYRIDELQHRQGDVPPHGTCNVVKQHTCAPLDNLHEAEYNIMWLFACKGYLMVASKKKPDRRRRRRQTHTGLYVPEQRLWLYDLSTETWTDLPSFGNSAGSANIESFVPYRDFMCELQRDILPRTEPRGPPRTVL